MTKPIRNTEQCFHLSLPRQRGQRDVLSHTELINVHILHALSPPGHPLRVTRKPPTANWWVLLLDKYYNKYRPLCEVCTRDRGKVVGTLQGDFGRKIIYSSYILQFRVMLWVLKRTIFMHRFF